MKTKFVTSFLNLNNSKSIYCDRQLSAHYLRPHIFHPGNSSLFPSMKNTAVGRITLVFEHFVTIFMN